MAPAIVVENVSKKYRLARGAERLPYRTLRDDLVGLATWPLRYARGQTSRTEDFWALNDVSFEVQPGEVVGIIGRNGAGKSTLLKVLSRITRPTTGRVRLRGRVGSLLEVGTGFHPELTGRENIYLSGAVLGMKRAEIRRKFDEIVAFAEVEKFLDLPVKRYSSGMYVRLAFAVAAHLEPEILLVDEVLAVGDAAFQKKCLGRMGDIAKGGRTIIFVSHNMAAVQSLCEQGIVLSKGRVCHIGSADEAVSVYLRDAEPTTNRGITEATIRSGTGMLRLLDFWIEDSEGRRIDVTASGQELQLVFRYQVAEGHTANNTSFGFSLHTALGDTLCVLYSDYSNVLFSGLKGEGEVRYHIPELPLNHGQYPVGLRVVVNGVEADWLRDPVATLNVVAGDYKGINATQHSGTGPLLIPGAWQASTATFSTR